MFRRGLWLLVALTFYALAMRLLPYALREFGVSIDPDVTVYPWNFAPLTAVCLFGAANYSRKWALAVPLVVLLGSNLAIGLMTGRTEWMFYPNLPLVVVSFLLMTLMGRWLTPLESAQFRESNDRSRLQKVLLKIGGVSATALLAETLFFLVTNFGSWALQEYNPYPPTYAQNLSGLMQCYLAGLPFFGRSLISTGIYSAILFSPLVSTQSEYDRQLAPAEPGNDLVSADV